MGNITMGLVFVMFVNVLMWFSQLAVVSVNPSGTVFYDCRGSILDTAGNGCSNSSVLYDSNLSANLPSVNTGVSPTSGNIFTDIFSAIKSWFVSLPGINYLYGMISAPYTILSSFGLPHEFVWGIGTVWYGLTFFFIVAFIAWRND